MDVHELYRMRKCSRCKACAKVCEMCMLNPKNDPTSAKNNQTYTSDGEDKEPKDQE